MKARLIVSSCYDWEATDPELERLKPDVEVFRCPERRQLTEAEMIGYLPETQYTLSADDPFNARVIRSAPSLQMICCDGVGVDHIDLTVATECGVIVNNAPVVHDSNGEFAVGLIVALLRKIVIADRGVRTGEWHDRVRFAGDDLQGKTLGLLGFGRVAKAFAKRISGFDMKVIAYCRNPDRRAAEALGVTLVGFDALIERSDILSLHVTLTDLTRGMIGAGEIGKMKTGAYLMNTSRGAVVDEAALIEALRRGKLAGAALDVFDGEPPSLDNPLLHMDNVVVSPHLGTETFRTFRAAFRSVVDDILRLRAGRRPRNVVNVGVLNHDRWRNLDA